MRTSRPSSCDGVAHLDRRPNRAQRVVLVDLREPEDGHRRVADELLDRAAVALEDRAELGVVARHDSRRTSGSFGSPSAVEPTRSQKTTVTVLRTATLKGYDD